MSLLCPHVFVMLMSKRLSRSYLSPSGKRIQTHTNTIQANTNTMFRFWKPQSFQTLHSYRPTKTRLYATYRRFNGQKPQTTNLLQDPTSRKIIGGVIAFGSIFYVSNLHEAPVTGRRRFIWTSESMERTMGDYSYRQLLAQFQGKLLADNHPQTVQIKKIFKRILDVSPTDTSGLDWKVHVIHDPHSPPNAFVLPGGKVFVISSILPICQNKDGIATVLSHEYAHQLARHTGENMSQAPIYAVFSLALYALTGADFFSRFLLDALLKKPASREMETEADYIGLMLMSEACFDPREAPHVWERMTQFEKGAGQRVPEFLSTHPASTRRIENMNKWLPDAMDKRQRHCDDYSGFSDLRRALF